MVETAQRGISWSVLLTKYYLGYQIKNELGGIQDTNGEEEHIGVWWGNLRWRGHLEDLGVDGWIILKLGLK